MPPANRKASITWHRRWGYEWAYAVICGPHWTIERSHRYNEFPYKSSIGCISTLTQGEQEYHVLAEHFLCDLFRFLLSVCLSLCLALAQKKLQKFNQAVGKRSHEMNTTFSVLPSMDILRFQPEDHVLRRSQTTSKNTAPDFKAGVIYASYFTSTIETTRGPLWRSLRRMLPSPFLRR